MTTFVVTLDGRQEQWDEVAFSDGWITCKTLKPQRMVYYPTHRVTQIEVFENTPQPSEVRVSWDELERRSF